MTHSNGCITGHALGANLVFFYWLEITVSLVWYDSKVFLLAQTMRMFINKTYKDNVDSNFLDKSLDAKIISI